MYVQVPIKYLLPTTTLLPSTEKSQSLTVDPHLTLTMFSVISLPLVLVSALSVSALTYGSKPINYGYDVEKVKQQAVALATHSWEYGTAAEALLEFENPEISVFGSSPFPIPSIPPADVSALAYAKQHIYLNSSVLIPADGLCPPIVARARSDNY